MGHQPYLYEVDGEIIEIPSPGNFEILVDAFILSAYGHEAKGLDVVANQEFLREDAFGKLVAYALDKVYEHDSQLVHDTIVEREELSRKVGYAILVEEITVHLLSPLDAAWLRDPGRRVEFN